MYKSILPSLPRPNQILTARFPPVYSFIFQYRILFFGTQLYFPRSCRFSTAAATNFILRCAVVIDRRLSYSPSVKVVALLLHADVNDKYDFNGYQNRVMTVTVTVGWKINEKFLRPPLSTLIAP